ncbi:MAG: hypothetical protein E6Q97_09355 [Desulfurellales bacterium]|nr:MAG: hypothetical protein E6Q97_09355 [Desulfurellales bacterium]
MSTWTYKGLSRHWHPVCTTELLFDNLDGSPARLGCVQNTCITARSTGTRPVTACRNTLLPSGHTDAIFEWGIEGGPWVLPADYSQVLEATQEFIDPGTLSELPAVAPGETLYNASVFNGNVSYARNLRAFSNTFAQVRTARRGYRALDSESLEDASIDPAAVLSGIDFEPAGSSGNCQVTKSIEARPEIEYYDVGVSGDNRPSEHDVVFSHAYLLLDTEVTPIGSDLHNSAIGAQPVSYAFGITTAYNGAIHPDVSAATEASWNSTWVSPVHVGNYRPPGAISFQGAGFLGISHPARDTAGLGGVVEGFVNAPSFHTGYRMQRHVQQFHFARFGQTGAEIRSGYRHIETRMYPHGYYATWEVQSIVPDLYIALSITDVGGGNVSIASAARGTVTIRVRYVDFRDNMSAVRLHEYGPDRSPATDPLPTLTALQTYNPPINRYVWERTRTIGLSGQFVPPIPGELDGTHVMASGSLAGNLPSAFSIPTTHTGAALPVSSSNPLSPQNPSGLFSYVYPLSWVGGPVSMVFSPAYSPAADPTYIRYVQFGTAGQTQVQRPSTPRVIVNYPLSPNDFQFRRQKA